MKISISLVAYNAEKYIRKCLNSVFAQTFQDFEVIIIDNVSSDNTVKIVKKEYPKCKVIENKENAGFAKGHNQGIRAAKGELVLCLNQDVFLDKNFLQNVVRTFDADEKIGAVQAKLYRADKNFEKTNIIDTTGLVMLKNRRIIGRGQGTLCRGNLEVEEETGFQVKPGMTIEPEEIFGCDGAVPTYRKRTLEDLRINDEYFDEDFFMYKEDVDLAWRTRLYGWKAVYVPTAIAWHQRGSGDSAVRNPLGIIKERRKISQNAKFYSFKNQRLMQIKNELPLLFVKDLIWIISKEIGAWAYVLIFEHYTVKSIISLCKEIPAAWRKRRIIMKNRKVGSREMGKFFQN